MTAKTHITNMTLKQQQRAIKFLKATLDLDDQNPCNDTGYNEHGETLALRLFLIEVGAIPDRRGKK